MKAASESVSSVYKCREYTSNDLIRKILKFIAIPYGLAKYFFRPRDKTKREGLALVLIAKDEGAYLEEWVNFHAKQGVSHFFIYDNESTDNTYEVLKPFIDSGIVTYKKLRGSCRQHDAYNMAFADHGRKYKYMGVIDADEFLFVRNITVGGGGMNLYEFVDEFMNAHPNAGGIGVNWLMFGSSGHETKPEGGVLKNFLMCTKKDIRANFLIKTICDPLRVLAWQNPHYPIYRHGYHNLDVTGEVIYGAFTKEVHHETIRINHYYTKSKEEYFGKINRGFADKKKNTRNIKGFYAMDFNDEKDTEILNCI